MRCKAITIVTCAVSLAVALATTGCSGPPATPRDRWPQASAERTIAEPADLLRWPLTGVATTVPSARTARVAAVPVAGATSSAYQVGLGQADVVYETSDDGHGSRLTALFQSHAAPAVGPVGPATAVGSEIVTAYAAVYGHASADAGAAEAIAELGIQDIGRAKAPAAYWQAAPARGAMLPFTSVSRLRSAALGSAYSALRVRPLAFGSLEATTSGARRAVAGVTLPFASPGPVSWTWSRKARLWTRGVGGAPAFDGRSGQAVTAANVVVLWSVATRGAAPAIRTTGSGRAALFRDGTVVNGTWRARLGQPPVLRTEQGASIPLAPGATWFEVVPNDFDIGMR